jgi:repressor LexA
MSQGLTAIERRILQLICTALMDSGRPPSIQELQDAAGVRSVATMHGYLDRLQRKGLIRRHPTEQRSIQVDCHEFALSAGVSEATPVAAGVNPEEEPVTAAVGTVPAHEDTVDRSGIASADAAVGTQKAIGADRNPEIYPETAVAEVPLLGEIAAGTPRLASGTTPAEADAVYRLPRDLVGHGENLFMLRIHGDSMLQAGILDGDYVIVRPQATADDGEIVAALIDGEATVKRLSRGGGRLQLLADNPAFQPIEPEDAQMLGKIVTVIRRLY